jgi:hypothetical protein
MGEVHKRHTSHGATLSALNIRGVRTVVSAVKAGFLSGKNYYVHKYRLFPSALPEPKTQMNDSPGLDRLSEEVTRLDPLEVRFRALLVSYHSRAGFYFPANDSMATC